MITNPFDEIGVEEALQIKEKHGGEVIVVSIGSTENQQNIRTALAMGADRGILILQNDREEFINTEFTAHILKNIIDREKPDLILMGKQSIDTDNHQTAEFLSELLDVGNASQANKINIDASSRIVTVIKEADGGLETISLKLPCVISTDLRLNEPRYASLPGIMKAKRKKIDIIESTDLSIPKNKNISILNVKLQIAKTAGIILKNVDELLEKIATDIKHA
jgi:electron transfer flavoprotein beta subunit